MMGVLAIILAAMVTLTCQAAWQENVRPKMYVQLGEYAKNVFKILFTVCTTRKLEKFGSMQ